MQDEDDKKLNLLACCLFSFGVVVVALYVYGAIWGK